MSAQPSYDAVPLTWVKGEIDQALAAIRQCLDRFSAASQDAEPFAGARGQLHQIGGVLNMVGLQGPARLNEEVENLLKAIETGAVAPGADAVGGLRKALAALGGYLEDLMRGGSNAPVRLFPALRAVMEARGITTASPSDLFFPNLNIVRPGSMDREPMAQAEWVRLLKDARARFQRGLLRWLKGGDPGSALEMADALRSLSQAAAPPDQRCFWWVACAFLEALAQEGLALDLFVKQLAGKIDQEMRRLAETGHAPGERLLRDLLYQIACARPVTESVREVQQVFELRALLPSGQEPDQSDAEAALFAFARMRELMAGAKEAWEKCAAGGLEFLGPLIEKLSQLKQTAASLKHPLLEKLFSVIGAAAVELRKTPARLTETLALEMATGFLLAEHAMGGTPDFSGDWKQQLDAVAARIKAAALGQWDEALLPPAPRIDETSRKKGERELLNQLAREIEANLKQAELVLDGFFRDRSKRADLPWLEPLLKQVSGAFSILELERGRQVLDACQKLISRFANDAEPIDPADLELLAEAMSSVGFYAQTLCQEQPDEALLEPVLARLGLARKAKAALVVEVPAAFPELVEALEEITAAPAPIAEVLEPKPAAAPEAGVPAEVARDVASDQEMLEVFLDEARDVLSDIQNGIAACRRESANRDGITAIRRGFHTLKGSGRMIGLKNMGEVAWALEQVINKWMEECKPADSPLLNLVTWAAGRFGSWVDSLKTAGYAEVSAGDLTTAAAGVRTDGPAAEDPERGVALVPEPRAPEPAAKVTVEPASAVEPAAEAEPAPAVEPPPPQSVAEAAHRMQPPKERRAIRDDLDSALLPIFLEEARELIPVIGAELRVWRANPQDGEAAKLLKRSLHTLKGSARMAGAIRLGELTHKLETQVEALLAAGNPEASVFDALDSEFDRLCAQIEFLQKNAQIEPQAAFRPSVTPVPDAAAVAAEATKTLAAEAELLSQQAVLRVKAELVDRLVNEAGEVTIARSRIEAEMHRVKLSLSDLMENVSRLRNQLREIEIHAESRMQSRMEEAVQVQDGQAAFDPLEFDRFTRLQELTRAMAESVSDVATIQQNLQKNLDETKKALASQARTSKELQQELMRVRAVPFGNYSERFYRTVRQAARDLDKKAGLSIQGGSVELDRGVLERVTSPIEHMLRNAVAHGIEAPQARLASGKPEAGKITLTVRQEGNEVSIVLADDGAGLDLETIRRKAVEKGLLDPEQEIPESRLMQFIFAPGFSTAKEVTEVSGRGVGMDVVRSEITALGGRVEVDSKPGKGAVFSIYLPLTLAVAQAVLVKAGAWTYAIPSAMVEQVRKYGPEQLRELYEKGAVELLGNVYPFFYLPRLLGDTETPAEAKGYNTVLFLRRGSQRIAAHVDDSSGNQEVVIKNIGRQLAGVPGIEGATVLGNGWVVLIINPVQLAQREDLQAAEAAAAAPKPVAAPWVMVVDDSLTVRKITGRLLAREGYQVTTAKDGVEALEQLAETVPDVMLVDIEMPRMDGFDLTRHVRSDPRTAKVPIIMITSRTAEKHRNYAKELGVNIYLGKPYPETELLGHIAEFVKG